MAAHLSFDLGLTTQWEKLADPIQYYKNQISNFPSLPNNPEFLSIKMNKYSLKEAICLVSAGLHQMYVNPGNQLFLYSLGTDCSH